MRVIYWGRVDKVRGYVTTRHTFGRHVVATPQDDHPTPPPFTKVNSTMFESMDRISLHLTTNTDKVGRLLKNSETNINNTLFAQVEEIQKYIMPTMKQFTDTLASEMGNVKQVIGFGVKKSSKTSILRFWGGTT